MRWRWLGRLGGEEPGSGADRRQTSSTALTQIRERETRKSQVSGRTSCFSRRASASASTPPYSIASLVWKEAKSDSWLLVWRHMLGDGGGRDTPAGDVSPAAGRTQLAPDSTELTQHLRAQVPSRPRLQANRSRSWHALTLAMLASFFSFSLSLSLLSILSA